jgi:hypothetical protein
MAQSQEKVSLQEAFDRGSKLLADGKASEAVTALRTIAQTGYTSPGLEANLGRALIETNALGEGIVHLTNAVALDRWDARTRQDLTLAESRVANGLGAPMSHPAEWAHRVASYARPLELLSGASFILLLLLAARALRVPLKRAHYALGFLLAFATLALGAFATTSRSLAIVRDATELHATPLGSSEKIQDLVTGTRVRIIRTSGAFAEIERSNALRGWAASDKLTPLPF